MNITSAQYWKDPMKDKVTSIKIVMDGETSNVPIDPANTDYAEILKQVKEGTLTIKDAE